MTTEVHFRRNLYIMALSPVTQVGEKSLKALFVVSFVSVMTVIA